MNTALIFAGGTGQRMNSRTKPKQFLELHGKPIIIYTLEHFDAHPEIDSIVVVCLEEWIPYLENLLSKFDITKVVSVVPGGTSGQHSIYRGLCNIAEHCPDDTIVLIHDGVRPLINAKLISDNIHSVLTKGSAITVTKAIETVVLKSQAEACNNVLDRNDCEVAKAPQSFYLKDILAAHRKALVCGKTDMTDSATLMQWFKKPLHSVPDENINIKITTAIDFYIFRAILDARESTQIYELE